MAGASDKARFYLEQQVPELREWERREIFSPQEITAISAKRSDFEHILNARGSTPSDYARYAEYEMNLDSLRKKRVKRKGVKTTAYTGQRRIFNILDRATRKFHGDVGLWMQYIEYARSQKANKKLSRLLTEVLRMHPTKPELWIYAARYAMDVQADISSARSFMQRGMRFNQKSRSIYVEYARLEMGYVAKISARRKILGIESSRSEDVEADEAQDDEKKDDNDADMIVLPSFTADDLATQDDDDVEDGAAKQPIITATTRDPALTPAMTGAIPLAIFDAAMKQFASPPDLAEQFFDIFAIFANTPSTPSMLSHVVNHMGSGSPNSACTLSCACRQSLIGVPVNSPAFPAILGRALKDIKTSLNKTTERAVLAQKFSGWLLPISTAEDLAPELKKVISATLRQLNKETDAAQAGGG